MAARKVALRFAVRNAGGTHRASTWKCWTMVGGGESDVYLGCRELDGELKVSMHESGYWHVAFSSQFHERQAGAIGAERRMLTWQRPKEIGAGVTLACRVVTPSGTATSPIDLRKCKGLTWIDEPPAGRAIEVNVVLVSRTAPAFEGWPGSRGSGTKLIGHLKLDDGSTVWAVRHERDARAVRIPAGAHPVGYFRGNSAADLKGEGRRAILFGDADDGAVALHEALVRFA